MSELVAAVQGVNQGGCRFQDLGKNLHGICSGGSAVWVRYVGDDTAHWKGFGRITPQGVRKYDGTTTYDRAGWWVGVSPAERISKYDVGDK